MENLIIIALVALILGLAIGYIYKQKKRGARCIGCPDSGHCASNSCGGCSGNCGHCHQ